ncbi:sugar-specific transcriptional regulator TrmB [Methanoregula sp.]|uniref:sugar-specific transcriptional regulator TrmB n=1 Tax=Methanoregula sp. TaxID=2052170 RepID=UPI002CE5EF81|nr:sugar-specific transcriptional regulator TrmB [Methanoregula sp.]HVP95790.1 sugar-specific transcriptional regulator TrmB [Methanoregula sp.]
MASVLEHRREYLRLMRQFTQDAGFFTVTDIQKAAGIPRSTAQDWVTRLVREGCVLVKKEKSGRMAARYAALSAIPESTCRRIFTTTDGRRVEIFHDCMSGACAAFCGYHHLRAGGVINAVTRDGTLLRECARIGDAPVSIGLSPDAAVGISGIACTGDHIIQRIRCIGGPAYSLTDMMARAEGVARVELDHVGGIVEGKVWTQALTHLTIGVDDTDSNAGGATFALALALLTRLSAGKSVLPISHHVVMLNDKIDNKTAGNSSSYIEVAVHPSRIDRVMAKSREFVENESLSPEWGLAFLKGMTIPPVLREYGRAVRCAVVDRARAEETAQQARAVLTGGNGVIGALGAIALARLPHEIQLDPAQPFA